MRFDDSRSIFLQISDYLSEMILQDEYSEGGRVPSIREMAVQMEVNPNTVIRSYGLLQEKGIIYNQRGMGYFVADEAKQQILGSRRDEFMKKTLPELFRTMEMLKIDFSELEREYRQYREALQLNKEMNRDENE